MNLQTNIKTSFVIWLALAFVLSLSGVCNAYAQSRMYEVKGSVKDQNSQPVIGATIVVNGTTTGTTADLHGRFEIRCPGDSKLLVECLGYEAQEVAVGGRTYIDVVLKEGSQQIEEVVVEVGYGGIARQDVTGTLGTVKIEDMAKAPVIGFDQALQGRIAGVHISSGDGQPGDEMDIVIRGANSLTQSNAPLYVVDGFPVENFSTSSVSTSDIESLTVLKDASATAIYGARGANGVVVIETKKGKAGRPEISYTGTFGFQQATKTMDMMSAADFVTYQTERSPAYVNTYLNNLDRTMEDYRAMGQGIDWQDKLFRDAFIMMHNVSVSGGTKKLRYAVSGSASDQKGVILNTGYKKYNGRVSLIADLTKSVKLKFNASYSQDKTYGQTSSAALSPNSQAYASYLMYRTWAYRPVSTSDVDLESELFDDESDGSNASTMNPVLSTINEDKVRRKINFRTNARLEFLLAKGLKLNISGGYALYGNRLTEFNNSSTYKGYPMLNNTKGVNGSFSEVVTQSYVNENTLNYDRRWGKNKHRLNAVAGFTLEKKTSSTFGYASMFVPNENLGVSGMDDGLNSSMNALLSENTLMSLLARVNYSYKSRYMATVSMRADGSSKFAKGNRWGYFPSAALAWRISEERWMQGASWLSDAKIRVSYGWTGNNNVGDYARFASLAMDTYYSFNNNVPTNAMVTDSFGNPDLTWETTEQFDAGIDIKLFDSRVALSVDWYNKVTRDLLLNANIPYSSGYTSVYKNVGKVRNRGLEVSLSTLNINHPDFKWTTDFNISLNRSKVLALADGERTMFSKVSFTGDFNATNLYITQVGAPMTQFYGVVWDGCYGYNDFDVTSSGEYVLKKSVPSNGMDRSVIQPGDIKYVDQNGDGVVNDQDMVVIGRCEPLHVGGFNNTFTYKNLSLSIFFQWSYGADIMNANRIVFEGNTFNRSINQFASYADRWSPENQDSRNFRTGGQGPVGVYSSRTIEDGSFLRLKTLQLSYALPERAVRKIGLRGLIFTVSGQNLWTWTKYSGLDPEVSTRNSALTPNFDYSAYARNRIFTGGVQIMF